jgi:hypothetical protein
MKAQPISMRMLFAVMRTVGLALAIGVWVLGPNANDDLVAKTADVDVTVDLSAPDMVSNFAVGLTHTHGGWEWGHRNAVERVKQRLEDAQIRYQNTHIMGWGPDNPNPEPGVYDWSSLDSRMDLIRSMDNTIPIITLATAPGWMKTSGEDWNMEDRVADEHVEDFAMLCGEVALRYADVRYFQVWNEFKGYRSWDGDVETKDMERFTTMYNAVYNAVKSVRPDANIGGPYMPMGGRDVSADDREDVEYWLMNSHGADFFTYDGWLEGYPPGGNTEEWMMSRTSFFGDLTDQFGTLTDLPMWVSEYYAGRSDNAAFTAANHASTYYHSLKRGTRVALLWDGAGLGELFSDTESAGGGQPTAHYFVVKAFHRHFGPGTQLYKTESSSDDIEVLASLKKTMLINKRLDPVSVSLNGVGLSLRGYEVRLVDAL